MNELSKQCDAKTKIWQLWHSILCSPHTHTHTHIHTNRHTHTDRQTQTVLLLDVSLEESGGVVPTLIPPWGCDCFLFSLSPQCHISSNMSDCLWLVNSSWIMGSWGLFNTWPVLLVLLHLVTRMSEQWSHNMNYDHKKWTIITSLHE